MKFQVKLIGRAIQSGQVVAITFNNRKAWKVQIDNGKEAVLYNCGNEWMQRNEDTLDAQLLITVGKCIEGVISKKIVSA